MEPHGKGLDQIKILEFAFLKDALTFISGYYFNLVLQAAYAIPNVNPMHIYKLEQTAITGRVRNYFNPIPHLTCDTSREFKTKA